MPGNRKHLIDQLATARLDNRFIDIVPVNCDPVTGDKLGVAGCFSVVFKAKDTQEGNRPVAIKFFDPEVKGAALAYRHDAFRRECELLKDLAGRERCLQLVQPITDLTLAVPMAGGGDLMVSYSYFVTEWLNADIQDHFEAQDQFEALAKLSVFRDAALACFALHINRVHHRDLKPDNLMTCDARGGVAIAIDLGSAARFDSAAILGNYGGGPVGAQAISPPEAFLGFAGVRSLGEGADTYALGCLLYMLFNAELFYLELIKIPAYQAWRSSCEAHLMRVRMSTANEAKLLSEFSRVAGLTKHQVTLPSINDPGSTVPSSVAPVLNDLLWKMTAIDFNDRVSKRDDVLRRVDSAIRILKNALADKRRNDQRKALRARRIAQESAKQARLAGRQKI